MRALGRWLLFAVLMFGFSAPSLAEEARSPLTLKLTATQETFRLGESAQLQLVIGQREDMAETQSFSGAQLQVRLHLPPGFSFLDGALEPLELEPTTKDDETGPWSSYQWTGVVDSIGPDEETVRTIEFQVESILPGSNWVMTAQLEAEQGERKWVEHAVLFATVEKRQTGKFHTEPHFDLPS